MWITAQQTILGQQIFPGEVPGEQFGNAVLNADLVSVLGLIIVLLALVIVVVVLAVLAMMYYSNKGLSTMATTQQNMSSANAQWAVSDSKKTEALNRSVDELTLMRQDFAATSSAHQRVTEQTKIALDAHEDKTDGRVKSIIDQVTAGNESIHGALKEAVNTVNSGTRETVKPALEALNKLVILSDTFDTRTEATQEMLRQQHDEEMRFLKEQHEAHMRIWREHLTQAQHAILDSLMKTEEKAPHEDFIPLPTPLVITARDPLATTLEPDAADTRPG